MLSAGRNSRLPPGDESPGLHGILGSDTVEVLLHHRHLVGRSNIAYVQRYSYGEVILVGILITRRIINLAHLPGLCGCSNDCTGNVQTGK